MYIHYIDIHIYTYLSAGSRAMWRSWRGTRWSRPSQQVLPPPVCTFVQNLHPEWAWGTSERVGVRRSELTAKLVVKPSTRHPYRGTSLIKNCPTP